MGILELCGNRIGAKGAAALADVPCPGVGQAKSLGEKLNSIFNRVLNPEASTAVVGGVGVVEPSRERKAGSSGLRKSTSQNLR